LLPSPQGFASAANVATENAMHNSTTFRILALSLAFSAFAGCGGSSSTEPSAESAPPATASTAPGANLLDIAAANSDLSAAARLPALRPLVPGTIEPCEYLPLASNPDNATVCVDVPVNLSRAAVVFNMDMDARDTSTTPPTPIGMRHMVLVATALKARVAAGLIQTRDIAIVGVFHGAAASWVLNDAWWQSQVDAANNPLYPDGNPYKNWLDQLLAFKAQGIPVQLELCGVTMNGKGWTNANLYPGVLANQGAIGRLIALENAHFAFIHPAK
jgi:intracellular sulfur oxidation DsrE/DsrF family protein